MSHPCIHCGVISPPEDWLEGGLVCPKCGGADDCPPNLYVDVTAPYEGPVTISLGNDVSVAFYTDPSGTLTPERAAIYTLMLLEYDSVRLRKFADAFETVGLLDQATMLRKRAALRDRPESLKTEQRERFRQTMASTDAAGARKLAAEFEDMGMIEAPKRLLERADALDHQGRGWWCACDVGHAADEGPCASCGVGPPKGTVR